MRSRRLQLIVTAAATLFIVFVFGVSCGSSYDQPGRAAPRGTAGRTTQENVRDTYRQLLEKMQNEGYDVSEAVALGEKAKRAIEQRNRPEAQRLLREAIAKLESLEGQPSRSRDTGSRQTQAEGEFQTEDTDFTVKSPHGYDLYVRCLGPKPSESPGKLFPAVLRIAGGWGPMTQLLDGTAMRNAASTGIVFVAFDSPLRASRNYPIGSSQRDYKGFKDQDDVAAVLNYVFDLPHVDPEKVGVWTLSSGVLLASGVLGRKECGFTDKVAFLLDVEGPHCIEDLLDDPEVDWRSPNAKKNWETAINAKVGPGKDYETKKEFFYERSGNNFIGSFEGIYQRIQGRNDHALGHFYKHAISYLNTATNGKAKWTRLNKQTKDQIYKSTEEPDGVNIEEALGGVTKFSPDDYLDILFEILEIKNGKPASSEAPGGTGGGLRQEEPREQFISLMREMNSKGYDTSQAQALGDRARLAVREGNRQEARKLLTEAIEKLKALESKSPDRPQPPGEKKTGKTARIELSVGSSQVRVTQSVPSATSGDKVESYQRAFKSETLPAKNGKVSLDLTTTPVFIEQMGNSDKQITASPGDSPFGISSPGFLADKDYRYWLSVIKEAGAGTVRFISRPEWGGMVWDLIEPEKGKFDWSKTDARYLAAKELGLNIVVNMYPVSQWDAPDIKELNLKYYSKFPGHYPNDMQEYLKFVTLATERYDGDGVGDAPGSPKVGVWILGAEMEMLGRWEGTPEEYAGLFVKTYDAIINSNPSAKVWIYGSNTYRFILNRKDGGVSRIEKFIEPMLKELAKFKSSLPEPPLIYPIHCYQHHRTDLVKEFSDELSAVEAEVDRMLKKSGFGDYAIVISDFGVFPFTADPLREQTGANDLVKGYTTGLAHGIKKIYWAQASDALHEDFMEIGLISKYGTGAENFDKNLLFYSYKLMTEKLQYSNWDKAEIVRESDGIHIYKFPKKNSTGVVWAAWTEGIPAE